MKSMTYAAQLRPIAKAVLPTRVFERIQAIRSRRAQLLLLRNLGLLESTKRYIERNGTVIRYGPFSGMTYPIDAAIGRHSIPKLLGTYENELHDILSLVTTRKYDCIVDIGSAEGYYAVGMALLMRVPVYAYDPEPTERALCSLMARLNNLDSMVKVSSLFTRSDIEGFSKRRILVLCDCEGFEAQLFTLDTLPFMSNWDMLIELHRATNATFPALPWQHSTRVIRSQPRTGDQYYNELSGIDSDAVLLSEYRGEPQQWLWCDGADIQKVR